MREELKEIVGHDSPRLDRLQRVADFLRERGGYRWVGLYDIDHAAGLIRNLVWSGPSAPEFPVFPITEGLTGVAVRTGQTVNAGDVAADPRYLTALGNTRSEIIVPVFDEGDRVVGTLDVESEHINAFDAATQRVLESCAAAIRPLWMALASPETL